MWFSNASSDLANSVSQWLESLSSNAATVASPPPLQRQPRLAGALEHLQRDWTELQRVRQQIERQPPPHSTDEELAALQQRVAEAEEQAVKRAAERDEAEQRCLTLEADRQRWE